MHYHCATSSPARDNKVPVCAKKSTYHLLFTFHFRRISFSLIHSFSVWKEVRNVLNDFTNAKNKYKIESVALYCGKQRSIPLELRVRESGLSPLWLHSLYKIWLAVIVGKIDETKQSLKPP